MVAVEHKELITMYHTEKDNISPTLHEESIMTPEFLYEDFLAFFFGLIQSHWTCNNKYIGMVNKWEIFTGKYQLIGPWEIWMEF